MKLFNFDTLITPSIIKFLFYIGAVVSIIGGLSIMSAGFATMQYSSFMALGYIVGGAITAIVGIIFSRVAAEMILVVFLIRDELAWQREARQTGVVG